jgi:oligoendopeptidase F
MKQESEWRLTDIYKSASELEQDITRIKRLVDDIEKSKKLLEHPTKEAVNDILKRLEKLAFILDKLENYSYLKFSQDTRIEESNSLLTKIRELSSQVNSKTVFFKLWWARIDSKLAKAVEPENSDFKRYLQLIRKKERYLLGEEAERAISLKDLTANAGWVKLYEMITSNFTYSLRVNGKYMKDDKGKVKLLSSGELVQYFYSSDPSLRKAAYDSLLGKYRDNSTLLSEIYINIVKDWMNEQVNLRNFQSAISARNVDNDISDKAVEALLSACRANASTFQDFFSLKSKLLGQKITRYDIYAPLEKESKKYTFPEAAKIVLDAFERFDEHFSSLAKNVISQQHIDYLPRAGKVSGAFCATPAAGYTPYILLNFTGDSKSVYTLAHESGHAVHSQLASNHSQLTFHAPLVLAETASVFGEMLLYDYLSGNQKSSSSLSHMLTQLYSTIQRQAYISIFEIDAFKQISNGSSLKGLCNLYLKNLQEQFGGSFTIPGIFSYEWLYIPHIFRTPFYCYAYAFGNLLALSLFNMYKEEGKSFVSKYIKILSCGGSESTAKILADSNIDIESRKFWDRGYKVVKNMLEELKDYS